MKYTEEYFISGLFYENWLKKHYAMITYGFTHVLLSIITLLDLGCIFNLLTPSLFSLSGLSLFLSVLLSMTKRISLNLKKKKKEEEIF